MAAELRVLIHAPEPEAALLLDILSGRGMDAVVRGGCEELVAELEAGAAAVLVAEQALPALLAHGGLAAWLERQPPWSDLPILVLAAERSGQRPGQDYQQLHRLGHLVLLERPLQAEALASAAELALRARRRQYAARRLLEELGSTRNELERLNGELESRILTRTRELASANDRLMKEIAERERAQAALTQAQKMEAIGRLTGGIAHDFNNLLHVVNMNLELVSLYAKEEKVKPVVDRAKSAARRGARLTNQLLSFARSQSLLPKLTRVNQLLLGMKDLLDISVGSAVQVRLQLCEEDATVLLDPGQLEMAIINLAVNSREAMPEGGDLVIATGTRYREFAEGGLGAGDYVVITVTDTGQGIAPQVLPKVFDPFFTTKPVGRGTGLGLSQVYGFARQSGGTAVILSEPGQGTTVEIWFPQADEETEEAMVAQAPSVPERIGSSQILVVEDDHDVRRVIVECLSLIGYQVTEAANGTEALAALQTSRPDLLVVDYAMPDLNGAEVICRARQMLGDIPVILATGYADMAQVERLAGRPTILRKPFDIAALGDAVRRVLEAREQAEAG